MTDDERATRIKYESVDSMRENFQNGIRNKNLNLKELGTELLKSSSI